MWWYMEGNKEQGWRRVGYLTPSIVHILVCFMCLWLLWYHTISPLILIGYGPTHANCIIRGLIACVHWERSWGFVCVGGASLHCWRCFWRYFEALDVHVSTFQHCKSWFESLRCICIHSIHRALDLSWLSAFWVCKEALMQVRAIKGWILWLEVHWCTIEPSRGWSVFMKVHWGKLHVRVFIRY